jgi:hypothetical protein
LVAGNFNAPQGIAIDNSSSPAILYLIDTGNNRVLAWKKRLRFYQGRQGGFGDWPARFSVQRRRKGRAGI